MAVNTIQTVYLNPGMQMCFYVAPKLMHYWLKVYKLAKYYSFLSNKTVISFIYLYAFQLKLYLTFSLITCRMQYSSTDTLVSNICNFVTLRIHTQYCCHTQFKGNCTFIKINTMNYVFQLMLKTSPRLICALLILNKCPRQSTSNIG